jgi:hypothetical protein
MTSEATTGQGDRGYVEWSPHDDSRQLVEDILSVVHYYRDGDYPAPTARDVYYDLLGWYGEDRGYLKGDKFKRAVYRLLSKMRRSFMVGFEEINDDSSDSLVVATFADPPAFWRDVGGRARHYHKDLTRNQPKRVVVFTEGAGAVRQFYEVAKDYTIPVYSPGGWDSLKFKYETAMDAVGEYRRTGRQTVILHAGDFDPDGVALFEVFKDDVLAFIADEGEFMADPEEIITFKRVMLHADQVPLNKRTVFSHAQLKAKNHRGRRWPHNFKAELQTLTLVERLDVMRAAIEAELDHAQLEEDRAVIEGEREEIRGELERLRDGE